MRRALLVLWLLLLPVVAEAQTVLWFAGLETGSTAEFPSISNGAQCTAVTSVTGGDTLVHSGAYALNTTNNGLNSCSVNAAAFSQTTVYSRFWFRHNNCGGSCASDAIVHNYSNGTKNYVLMHKTDNTLYWGYITVSCPQGSFAPVASGTTVLAPNVWYLIETKVVASATVGGMEVKINGVVEFSSFATNTSTAPITAASWGPACANNPTYPWYFDDLMVCTGGYCPAGRTLARQGIAGTPTYDTWTKTSCTGGVINGCWSDTPFSATSNANSATASAAQTMLVSPFNLPQTGHGKEFVPATATVNACKTVLIAKSGTASAPLSIRRRIGGADTDTAKTLTTGDLIYDDGIWTATPTQLNTAEIGALHGAGTDTDTVEDAWLMCDVNMPIISWFSGVEIGAATTNTQSEFTQFDTGSHHSATNSIVKSGGWALALAEGASNGGFAITKKSLNIGTGYFRTWFRFDGLPTSTQTVFRWLNSAQNTFVGVNVDTTGKLSFSNNGSAVVTGSTTLAANTYYLLESKAVVSVSGGGIELKINGATEFSSLASNTSAMTTLDQVQIGPSLNSTCTPCRNFYYDDMMICSDGYCPQGKTLARQGTTGTPTYNAWTKTSCAGGVINGCWSDTPFNATSNANSSTIGQAQTMFVSSFGSTQSGHGTETVAAIDTVNICKTAFIGHGSTSPLNIRRRLAGVDTDTNVGNMPGTDTYFDDGLWTTTATILRDSANTQIGAVQNSSGITEFVNDMWMICDTLAAPTSYNFNVYQD